MIALSKAGLALLVAAVVCVGPQTPVLLGQGANPIWSGAYTEAQAERGRRVSTAHCAECHSEALTGGNGPPLVGDVFMLHWEGQSVERLFRKIQGTMPPEAAQTMSDQERLDVVALILKLNGFPAGKSELTLKPDITNLMMIGKDGPAAPRNGAIVTVTGCLEKGSEGWQLSHATSPVLTTLDAPASESPATELGTNVVRLLSAYPDPVSHQGHRMEVKGLLVKDAAGDRVNVMSLRMLQSSCGN